MESPEARSFDTAPRMVGAAMGAALGIGCLLLAAAQAWPVVRHYSGARQLAAFEPGARVLFGLVFLIAGLGIAVTLLEQRRARVELTSERMRLHTWWGGLREVRVADVERLVLLRPAHDETGLPFHWLYADTVHGAHVRLSGGLWPEARGCRLLRHELADRLGLREGEPADASWALILAAKRIEWSHADES